MQVVINYPDPNFKIKVQDENQYIFDNFRKRYILLTPEEWVRQNLLLALVTNYNYPTGLIAVEKELIINGLKKRFDIVVYDRNRKPWMLIECKAPHVKLTNDTLNQSLNYFRQIQSTYLMISNGKETMVAQINKLAFSWLNSVPIYNL